MLSLPAKYVNTVRGDTSAAAAMSLTVVAAKPSRANNSSATRVIVARVRSFLRSLRP